MYNKYEFYAMRDRSKTNRLDKNHRVFLERIFLKLLTIAEAVQAHLCKIRLLTSDVTPVTLFEFAMSQRNLHYELIQKQYLIAFSHLPSIILNFNV